MQYSKLETQGHPIAVKYLQSQIDINVLLIQEGYAGESVFSKGEIVINMDLVEDLESKAENRLEKRKSMDSAFCIRTEKNAKIVLVEFKLNHTDFKFLRRIDMEEKVAGSTSILAPFIPIYYDYFFVVPQNLLNQAYSRFQRMNPRPGNQYKAICIESLRFQFFDYPSF